MWIMGYPNYDSHGTYSGAVTSDREREVQTNEEVIRDFCCVFVYLPVFGVGYTERADHAVQRGPGEAEQGRAERGFRAEPDRPAGLAAADRPFGADRHEERRRQ